MPKTLDTAPEQKVQGEMIRTEMVRSAVEHTVRDYRKKASLRLGVPETQFPDVGLDELLVQRVLDAFDCVKVVDTTNGVQMTGGAVMHHPI